MRVLHIAATAFLTGFSGAVMPGPMLALTIGQVSAQGFIAVLFICGGHALLELGTVVMLMLGLRTVLVRPAVRGIIGVIGGGALIYMGGDMIRSATGMALTLRGDSSPAIGGVKLMAAGAAVCVANPYFIGWWATVGAGQLARFAPRTPAEQFAFYLGHEASDLTWYSLVGLLLVTGRRYLSPTLYQGMVLVCGASIAVLGAAFLWHGLRCAGGKESGKIELVESAESNVHERQESR